MHFYWISKGTKVGLFNFSMEQKVVVLTNAKYLEQDYLMNHVPRSKLVLQESSKIIISNASTKEIPQKVVEILL